MAETLATIGEVAERAAVATSTVRYYERLGLLRPDARHAGQRRYRPETLRRLVFIGVLKDAGLSLEDIAGILAAGTNHEWKAIARERLRSLHDEIDRLERARSYLAGTLQCPFDHPMTQCEVMGGEIDRRLGLS